MPTEAQARSPASPMQVVGIPRFCSRNLGSSRGRVTDAQLDQVAALPARSYHRIGVEPARRRRALGRRLFHLRGVTCRLREKALGNCELDWTRTLLLAHRVDAATFLLRVDHQERARPI